MLMEITVPLIEILRSIAATCNKCMILNEKRESQNSMTADPRAQDNKEAHMLDISLALQLLVLRAKPSLRKTVFSLSLSSLTKL